MSIFELFLIAVGLSMDAFAVSVCKGLSTRQLKIKHYLIIGAWFGGFQSLMPTIGYLLGSTFEKGINKFDHWAAFLLLVVIGAGMLKEGFSKEEKKTGANDSFGFKTMSVLAVATSIDALAVGITFAFLDYPIVEAIAIIGITTFCISIGGVYVGNFFGNKYEKKAEFAGGLILVLLGVRILLTHLGIL